MSRGPSKEFMKILVNAPFGGAEKILRDKGFWDESRVPKAERTVKEYEVELEGMQPVSATVTVYAKDEDEAIKRAKDEVCNSDWSTDRLSFIDVEDVEVSEIHEVDE